MVRTGGAEFSEALRVLRVHESQDRFVILDRADEALLLADLAAQPWQNFRENFLPHIPPKTFVKLPAEHRRIAALLRVPLLNVLRGALDQVQRQEIAFFLVIGP